MFLQPVVLTKPSSGQQRLARTACRFFPAARGWANTWENTLDAEKLFTKQKELSVSPIFTHALYLANLATDKEAILTNSVRALKDELRFDSAVRGGGVIVHLGSHQGRGWEASRDQVVRAIGEILEETPENSALLIENSAGQNGKVVSNLAEIRWLLDKVKSDRLGWCLDTAHAFAAGFALGDPAEVEEDRHQVFLEEPRHAVVAIEQLGLWETLKCIHVNDSKMPYGSGKDRHENLLDGEIPQDDFEYFLNLPQVQEIPLIMEVPGIKGTGPDAENVKRLQDLVGSR